MQIKKGHTIQWLKEKGQKDIQWSTKHNSEDARTPLITESELWCSTSDTRRVTSLITESKLWCFTSATRRVVHRFYSDIVADITGWNKTHEEIIRRHDKQEVQ